MESQEKAVTDGDFEKAEGFERVALDEAGRLAASPTDEHFEVEYAISGRLIAQSKWDEARAHIEAAVAIRAALGIEDRRTYDAIHRRGVVERELGNIEVAVELFSQALRLSRQLFGESFYPAVTTRVSMAQSLIKLGRYDEAEEVLEAALKVSRDAGATRAVAMVSESLAALHRMTGKDSAAREDSERAQDALEGADRRRAREEHDEKSKRLAEELKVIYGPEKPEPIEAILDDMDESLVGLAGIKQDIRTLADFLIVQGKRKEKGLKANRRRLHLLLVGPAGTGKTTVASYLGRICFSLGLLESGDVVEATRAKLVAGFVGQTAIRTNDVIDFSLGKVLFIDEAYALARKDTGNDFGHEAISELMVRMVSDAERLVVVAAGYEKEMKEFLESNTGFSSRFTDTFTFHDYEPSQLAQIFRLITKQNEYELTPDADKRMVEWCDRAHADRDERFGNGRAISNLFDDVIAQQASRLVGAGLQDDRKALMTIDAGDFGG